MTALRKTLAVLLALTFSVSALATPEKAAGFYEDALRKYDKNEMPAAIIQLKNALQQDSKMLAAHLLLGKALLKSGNLMAAEAAFEEAQKQGVSPSEVALPLGQLYLALGQPEKVIDKIPASGLPSALQVEALTMRGNAYLELGNAKLASQSFDNARNLDPHAISPLVAEAQMLLGAGKIAQAKEKANKALELSPNDAAAWNIKASVLHATFDTAGALAAYEKALSLQPRLVDARVARAALLIDLKRDADARKDLDYLKTFAEDEPRAAYLRAVLAARQGDEKTTAEAMKEVVRIIDPLPPAWLARREQLLMAAALAHQGLGDIQKAHEYLDTILARNPKNLGAKKLLASIYIDARDFGRAQPLLESLHRALPDDPQIMFLLGSVYLSQKHYVPAAELLEKAATLTGASDMRRRLAYSQLALGETEQGLGSLEKAFAGNPGDTRTGMSLAMLYVRLGKTDKAIKVAQAMVRQDAANLTALNFLGSLQGAAGDKLGARTIYQQVLAKDPDFTPAILNLVRLDVSEKKFDEARRRLDGLLKKRSDNYRVLFEYGLLEQRAGRPAEAIRHLTKAADVQRIDPSPSLALIDLYLGQHQADQALTVAKALAPKFTDNLAVQLALARAYIANGDNSNARTILSAATRLAEFNTGSQVLVARLQLAAANPDGAAYSLYKALQGNPSDLSALVLAVQVEARRGDSGKADAALKALTARYPTAAQTVRAGAELALSRGQYATAIAAYRKLLSREESTGNALALVQAYMAAGEVTKTAAFLDVWVKNHPNDLVALKALAETQYRAGQLAAAKQSYQRVAQADPEDAVSLNNYANLLSQQNDPQAQEIAERALKLAPKNSAYADTLGWILVSKGQIETGLRYLREARLRNPENGEFRFHLAYALAKIGRQAEARDEMRAAIASWGGATNNPTFSQLKTELGL